MALRVYDEALAMCVGLRPVVRAIARQDHLGVRVKGLPGSENKVDLVRDPADELFVLPTGADHKPQGMSVNIDDPRGAPLYNLPMALDGTSKGTLFELDLGRLPPTLRFAPLDGTHGVIAPAERMLFKDYEDALAATLGDWKVADVRKFQRQAE
jgi:hypothetical protein